MFLKLRSHLVICLLYYIHLFIDFDVEFANPVTSAIYYLPSCRFSYFGCAMISICHSHFILCLIYSSRIWMNLSQLFTGRELCGAYDMIAIIQRSRLSHLKAQGSRKFYYKCRIKIEEKLKLISIKSILVGMATWSKKFSRWDHGENALRKTNRNILKYWSTHRIWYDYLRYSHFNFK